MTAGPADADARALGAEGGARYAALLHRIAQGLVALPDKPEETAEATARVLWLLAAGRPVSAALACETVLPPLPDGAGTQLDDLVARRLAGVPLAHLSGRQRFMGLELAVGEAALIPRRETELLASAALRLLRETISVESPLVLDVCTGCGNVAVALAVHHPQAQVHASDLSPDAVDLARRNAALHGVQERVALATGDLLAPFDVPAFVGKVDLLVCNPPYISSGRLPGMASEIVGHEPLLAFDGGPFGLRIVQRLIQEAPRFVRPGGWLAFEVGLGQASALARRLTSKLGYADVRTLDDEAGAPRVIVAQTLA